MKKNEIKTFSNTIHKNKLKWIKDLNVRPDTTKLLEENIARIHSDINLSNIFFNTRPRVMKMKTKINIWYLIKLKGFAQQRKS